MTSRVLSRAIASILLAGSTGAFAITNVENNAGIPFSFSNPGARSLGMGGAFLGLADDATAAYTNPAGLTGLGLEQQVSIEVRRQEFDSEFATGGEAFFNPTDLSGVGYDRASDSVDGVSFLSWVLPRENWAIAVYRHELVNYQNKYSTTPTFFPVRGEDFAVLPYTARTDLEIINYGASFGFNVNEQISLGLGVSWYDFDIDSSTARYDALTVGEDGDLVSVQRQDGSDDDIGFNVGAMFKVTPRFNIGVAYRSAPKFEYQATNVAGDAFGREQFVEGIFGGQLLADKTTPFEAPDMFGLGFNWRPTDNLSINFDINRINYSNLSDGIENAFLNSPDDPRSVTTQVDVTLIGADGNPVLLPAGSVIPGFAANAVQEASAQLVKVDDVVEPRLGAEYFFSDMKYPLSLRAGVWQEKRHTLHADVDPSLDAIDTAGHVRSNVILFSTGSDEMHYSAGFGFAFPSFQLDFATDQADSQDIYTASAVWRF